MVSEKDSRCKKIYMKVKKMRIKDYMALISKYRTPIMGLAIINVLFGHSNMVLWGPFNYLVNAVWLIDIFFFFSGLGAYHSLTKNDNVPEFYLRRVKRIYPAYLPAVILYLLVLAPQILEKSGGFGLVKVSLGNILMLGWAAGLNYQFNWYPQAIMIVYLITPVIFFLIRRFDGNGKKLALLFAFFCVGQICFLGSNYLVAVSRILSFVLGMIAADAAKRDADIKLNIPLMLLLAVVGHAMIFFAQRRCGIDTVWEYGVTWYPSIIAIPGTMYLFCRLFEFAEKKKWLGWFMWLHNIAGKYSFEIFMFHIVFYEFAAALHIPLNSNFALAFLAVSAGVVSLFYGILIDKLRKKLKL